MLHRIVAASSSSKSMMRGVPRPVVRNKSADGTHRSSGDTKRQESPILRPCEGALEETLSLRQQVMAVP